MGISSNANTEPDMTHEFPSHREMPRSSQAESDIAASKTDPDSCDSLLDPIIGMLENNNYLIFTLTVASIPAIIISFVLSGCYLGRNIKPRPPKYWTSRRRHLFYDEFDVEVDVTDSVRPAIQALLDATTRSSAMGRGRDGKWATHKGFKVLKVTRIEHGKQWTRYKQIRRSMRTVKQTMERMSAYHRARTQKALDIITGSHAERELNPVVKNFINSLNLDSSRNERILFHGAPGPGALDENDEVLFIAESQSPMYALKRSGFDDRLGNVKGMYGSGTYFADMASKADQYAGRYHKTNDPNGSVGEHSTMFLARVVLGCPYLTNQSLEQLQRPPCIHGHFDLKLSWNQEVVHGMPWREKGVEFQICEHYRFDSVLGDLLIETRRKLYREYVVYERQSYPEFCVTYERVACPATREV